jgi:site-specific recombinase XerD
MHLERLRLAGRRPNTVEYRERAIRRLCRWAGVDDPLEITAGQLAAWRLDLEGRAVETVIAYVKAARLFYAWAAEEGLLAEDPSRRLIRPRMQSHLPRPMSEAALTRAVEAATGALRLWLVLGGHLGLRSFTIAGSRVEDVRLDLSPPVWQVTEYNGKGGTEYVVPLSGFVIAEIEAYGLPARGWCFVRPDGRHVTPAQVRMRCNRHLHKCGINATFHATRHRFGTQFYRASGHDLLLTAQVMGHRSVATTAAYAKVSADDAARVVDALDAGMVWEARDA